tara:strand:+ start:1858 stop:2721 length:864 start_codon:yes stop_codon:yes gene_type:complete
MKSKESLSHRNKEPENGVLYLVGTPIGNLSDISKRALHILDNVFLIACEDTRQTIKIMNKFNISNNLESFNEHNSLKKIPIIVNYLKEGKSIALVSDAGMPGICDPGEELVKSAKIAGYDVICIPGPCAAITALVSSGLPSSKFIFEGFLPKKKIDREKTLLEISKNVKTTIIFESPHRLNKLLKELKKFCGGSRKIQISKELTKKFEEHIGKNINEVIEFFENKDPIGEFTLILNGINDTKEKDFDHITLKSELHELVSFGLSLTAASKYLAKKNNIPKRIIYDLY